MSTLFPYTTLFRSSRQRILHSRNNVPRTCDGPAPSSRSGNSVQRQVCSRLLRVSSLEPLQSRRLLWLFFGRKSFAETLLGPVEENPQILAIDVQLAADIVFGPILEKQPSNQCLVSLCQPGYRSPHPLLSRGFQNPPLRARLIRLGLADFVVERRRSPARPIGFQQHVVGDGIDECP